MTTRARILVLLLVALFVMAPAAASATSSVLAFTAEAEDEAPVETTFAPGEEPAVVTPVVDAEARDIPWTSRYLAPVLLLGGVLVAIAYFAFYGARVRGKYEVVD